MLEPGDYVFPRIKAVHKDITICVTCVWYSYSQLSIKILMVITDWTEYYNNDRYQWDLVKLSPREYCKYVTTGVYPLPRGVDWSKFHAGGFAPRPPRFIAFVFRGDRRYPCKKETHWNVSPANPPGRSSRSSPLLYPPCRKSYLSISIWPADGKVLKLILSLTWGTQQKKLSPENMGEKVLIHKVFRLDDDYGNSRVILYSKYTYR